MGIYFELHFSYPIKKDLSTSLLVFFFKHVLNQCHANIFKEYNIILIK